MITVPFFGHARFVQVKGAVRAAPVLCWRLSPLARLDLGGREPIERQ
jgi:hypothetical protein